MPSQIKGFKSDGESKWFDGGRLPSGWSHEDPTLKKKESVPAQTKKQKAAAKKLAAAQDKADKEAQEAEDAQDKADKEAEEAADAQAEVDALEK